MTEEKLFELWKKANVRFDQIKAEQKEYNSGLEKGMDMMYEEVRKYIKEVQGE